MFTFEKKLQSQGLTLLAGMDEVGRGPLAGPVVVTCLILPLGNPIQGVNDSKKLSKKKRENLYEKIIEQAIDYNTVFIDEKTIDEINILNATKLAMKRAIEGLKIKPDCVLIDAVQLDVEQKTLSIIKGDAQSYLIAAASIVAKVTRDRFMQEKAKVYPNYDFENNSGYGTKKHIEGLKSFGACPLHRKTFIKKLLNQDEH